MRKFLLGLVGVVCALFAVPAHAALPDGYTQLEYIESTGTQYIDTGVVPVQNTATEIDFQFVDLRNDSALLGTQYPSYHITFYSNAWYFGSQNTSQDNTNWIGNPDTARHTVKIDGAGKFYQDGNLTGTNPSQSSTETLSILIFARRTGSAVETKTMSVIKVYNVEITNNGTLVRNLVPAKRNSDGAIGMYDTVSGTFFENSGTGKFIAGPETTGPCANLFDISKVVSNSTVINNGDGTLTVNTTQDSNAVHAGEPAALKSLAPNLKVGDVVTLSAQTTGNEKSIYLWEARESWSFDTKKTITADMLNSSVLFYASGVNTTATVSNIQIVPAYCSEIQVASTKYTETVFNPLNTALANAVATVNTVVTNTINQAGSIATLQSGKQTRPADETCPAYKQCLLVEDEQGTPHWYQITDPFRDFVAPIIANNVNGTSSETYDGYFQLEYIQSSGTQYIDTGVYATASGFAYDVDFAAVDGKSAIIGNQNNDILAYLQPEQTVSVYYRASTAKSTMIEPRVLQAGQSHNIRVVYNGAEAQVYFDGESRAQITGIIINPIFKFSLFANRVTEANMSDMGKLRIYYAKIWNSGTLVRNFIPAMRRKDNVVGMYDTVSGTFFTNAGSGSFTAGPAVTNTDVPYTLTWSVTWTANAANGVTAGTIYGEALNNRACGTVGVAATDAQLSSADWNTPYACCWCKITGINVDGNYTATVGNWVFLYDRSDTSNCHAFCQHNIKTVAGYRNPLFDVTN